GLLGYVAPLAPAPRWRNWQTRQLEGLVSLTARAGSSPVLGIRPDVARRARDRPSHCSRRVRPPTVARPPRPGARCGARENRRVRRRIDARAARRALCVDAAAGVDGIAATAHRERAGYD